MVVQISMALSLRKIKVIGGDALDKGTAMMQSAAQKLKGTSRSIINAAGGNMQGSAASETQSSADIPPAIATEAAVPAAAAAAAAPSGSPAAKVSETEEPGSASAEPAPTVQYTMTRRHMLWLLLAIGLFIAGVVLISLGASDFWHNSVATVATVRGHQARREGSMAGAEMTERRAAGMGLGLY